VRDMGRTVPSITGVYYYELAALSQFKHALRRSDQLLFDELFANARRHLAEAAYAAHPLPLEIFMLAMILEEHKEVMRIRQLLEGDKAASSSIIR
jgi:hypothetical protein